jgi:hypothetical protein
MLSCSFQLNKEKNTAHLSLTDFNRLRWTIAAIRSNPDLRDSLILKKDTNRATYLVDSRVMISKASFRAPARTHVVLWDGLNSLIELWVAQPNLKYRDDLTYLYVGNFYEVTSNFPAGSMPLFSDTANASLLAGNGSSFPPLWVDVVSQTRSYLRPIKYWISAPIQHKLLKRGRKIAFCGVVRPDHSVLDSFFRGTALEGLRQVLSPLERLEWKGNINNVRELVLHSFSSLQEARPTSPASWACMYSVLNVIHRLSTLAQISALTPHLFINEYGKQKHFDPYDSKAYTNNMYVDFGSTRGPDAIYPRTVDLLINNKSYKSLRLFNHFNSLNLYLTSNTAEDFWRTCEMHAQELVDSIEITN